ncbi:metallophosphoesterase [Ornithinibacillus sp. L9]|uniref:Metallophosphoesterase n=2 Tax=Ornithinibacillus caprae TaxID=2678566 RepID=A0A6N8FP38_9BACI|nr:metallophosphoesterase [Ornithinibacillus caprae]
MKRVSILLIFFLLFTHMLDYATIVHASVEGENDETFELESEELDTEDTDSKEEVEDSNEEQVEYKEEENTESTIKEETTEQQEEMIHNEEVEEKLEKEETQVNTTNSDTAQTTEETVETKEIDYQTVPLLLITEIMPDNDGADDYEYFEVYNNSDRAISLDYYTIALRYTDGSGTADKAFSFPETTIDPGETLVFWNNSKNVTVEDFNAHYQTELTSDQVVSYQGTGFYNSGQRGVVIKDGAGEVVSMSYLAEDIASGKVATYQFPEDGTEMNIYETLVDPTPGSIEQAQIPEELVVTSDHTAPTIEHQPITEAQEGSSIAIQAQLEDDQQKVSGMLHYRFQDDVDFQTIAMKEVGENIFEANIGAEQVNAGTLEYFITATDPNHRVRFPEADEEIISVEIHALDEGDEDFQSYPQLLITEISPNAEGGGTDYFEYFEVYNNTNQTLSFQQYATIYYYTDSGRELSFQVPGVEIESQETLVFWYNNGNNTLEDFNAHFSTNLSSDQVVEVTDSAFPGFANGGNRALIIRDAHQEEVIYADYDGADNDNTGAVIQYKYPYEGTKMNKLETLAAPTPGTIKEEQVPKDPVMIDEKEEDMTPPVIEHEPVVQADAFSSITIEAEITDEIAIPSATVYVKGEGAEYRSLAMSASSSDPTRYQVEIPGMYVAEDLTYYIEATDGVNVERTEEYVIEVVTIDVDTQSLPPLLVTEVVPDSTNVGSADGYEFIEVYNNTNQPIPFEHYKMQYRYGNDPASDVIWPSIPDDVVIEPQETLVFWIINGQNNHKTVADFNANYGSNLIEGENLVRIESAGMANGSMRGLIVASNIGHEYSIAYYNDLDTVDDTQPDKGIFYKYLTDGSNVMEKVSAGELDATPGMVEGYQVPSEPVNVLEDTTPPVVEHASDITSIKQTENLDVAVTASDQEELKTVAVHYRMDEDTDFQKALIEQGEEIGVFTYRIYAPEMIGKEEVEYYFSASDGVNTTETSVKTVSIESDLDDYPIRLNVEENQILHGTYVVKGTSDMNDPSELDMKIDGNVVENNYRALEHTAYFAFEVSGINTYFQNGVTIGDEIVHIFDDWMAQWETITVPIDPNYLTMGENTITIRAGNKATPWEGDPGENRDDYNLRNVRLVLADGTILTDPNHPDPNNVLDMGDDGTYRVYEDFTFTITEEHANSLAYSWDTTEVSDGTHEIELSGGEETIQTNVLVDNTAPTIDASIIDGNVYKGSFTIDAKITDDIAGIDSYLAELDGEKIELPYETSSGALDAGEHNLVLTAVDQVGNEAVKEIIFETVEEHPQVLENDSMVETGDPTLKVRVSDPMGDNVHVGFYQGFQYKPSDTESVTAYQGTSPVEPPNTKELEDESLLEEQEIALVDEKDGEYLVTDATKAFPYHRFDVTLDDSVTEDDIVELVWEGNSLEGRKVTMYAWNFESSTWEIVDYQIAGTDDFTLKGNVEVSAYSQYQEIHVLIQDEIPASSDDYDYTFVWMSDTQYYSESYPYIYERQTEWIVEMQEEMNIEYVFHSGDLVDDTDQEYQWLYADEYMKTLDDADVPYGVLAGNHDVYQKDNDYTEYYKYFGEDRFRDKDYYGGSYLNNRGHYDLISVEGNDYIMVYLGWGIDDEGIAWMNRVLSEHPDRTAILTFHEYLQATGTRHPLGEKLYQEVVIPNENVVAVLSGHYHEAQTLIDEIDDDGDGEPDRTVYQMLADYQAGPEGGQGYMRLLHFDTENNQIYVNTYSPYLDDYNYYDPEEYPEKDEFIINLDLSAQEKRVATDSFAVNVYTNNEIGSVEHVKSGETAEVTWPGLTEGERYFWYATITDDYSGYARSPIWSFVKGEDDESGGDIEDPDKNDDQGNTENGGSGGQGSNGDDDQESNRDRDNGSEKQKDKTDESTVRDENDGSNSNMDVTIGKGLPNTTTSIFNYLAWSLFFILLGLPLYIWQRKRSY